MTAALLVTACGGGGDDVDPTGAFDAVDGGAEASGGSGDSTPAAVPDDSASDDLNPEETGDDVGVPGEPSDGSGGSPDPSPTATSDAGGSAAGGDAGAQALAVWDSFLVAWRDLRNGVVTRDAVAAVAVLDEAMAELVDGSLEADAARGTTTVELYGGTRAEVVVSDSTVTFVDCVYEKALGSLPWVLAQRWDVTVGLTAGPDGAPAVTGLTQRATVGDVGEIVFDVCLNPVLEDEVVTAHIALRQMFVETQEDPTTGITDPRIDELLMPSNAAEFRSQLQARIDDGTRLVNGLGTNLRVQVFGHGLNFVGTISCEDQQEGYSRVAASGDVIWAGDGALQSVTTYRLVLSSGSWVADQTQPADDLECLGRPLDSVPVADISGVPVP
ncbi:MAG: hypothetical protein RIE08_15455 [Acidimicrobiales bacterium]